MFANLESEPIDDGCELKEAEEGDGKFVVASGDTAKLFHSAEEVFDPVASTVIAAMEGHGLPPATQPGNANLHALAAQQCTKGTGFEAFVPDHTFAT